MISRVLYSGICSIITLCTKIISSWIDGARSRRFATWKSRVRPILSHPAISLRSLAFPSDKIDSIWYARIRFWRSDGSLAIPAICFLRLVFRNFFGSIENSIRITYPCMYIFRPFWTLQRYLDLHFDTRLGHCFG